MHPALQKLLQALPPIFGGRTLVSNATLEDGGDIMTKYAHRQLASVLATFIVETKVLDDRGALEMRDIKDMDATEFTARVHVLTPQELEKLVKEAFEAGRQSGDVPRPQWIIKKAESF